MTTLERLRGGLADIAGMGSGNEPHAGGNVSRCPVVLNPWNFTGPRFVGFDPLDFASPVSQSECGDEETEATFAADVPGCGYAALVPAAAPSAPRAEGRTLRNEFLEVVIGERTGGIQSIRAHRDRATRVSQRLVYVGRKPAGRTAATGEPTISMVADRVEVTRADAVVGEIAARGRLVAAGEEPLARFRQTVRLVSSLPAVIVCVEFDECAAPEGGVWESYIASRLAWRDEPLGLRRGVDWVGRATNSARIESPDWIEISDEAGQISCFALGLPFHCRSGPNWLDTLLVSSGETCRSFQLAIGLDCRYPTQTALSLLTAGKASSTNLQSASPAPRGWFLHASAGNVVVTHVEALAGAVGIRARLLETEGRGCGVSLAAFRPFRAAWRADLCGQRLDALPVVDGAVQMDLGPHRWWQLEAEW
jgi:hypothetical protein